MIVVEELNGVCLLVREDERNRDRSFMRSTLTLKFILLFCKLRIIGRYFAILLTSLYVSSNVTQQHQWIHNLDLLNNRTALLMYWTLDIKRRKDL